MSLVLLNSWQVTITKPLLGVSPGTGVCADVSLMGLSGCKWREE